MHIFVQTAAGSTTTTSAGPVFSPTTASLAASPENPAPVTDQAPTVALLPVNGPDTTVLAAAGTVVALCGVVLFGLLRRRHTH